MIRTSSIFPKGFFTEESTRRTPKEQGSKGFKSSISYILLGITEVLAPTSQRAKHEKLFNLIFIIGSQPSSIFLGMEASTLSFSSLTLIRALVICSVKARLSVLVLIVCTSSKTWIVATVWWVGQLLTLSSSSLSLAHLSLSFPNILMFSLICTWIAFIGVVFLSSGGEVLI